MNGTVDSDWFGSIYRTQVVASDGTFSHLGTMLMANRKLVIDYATKSVVLE